MKLNSFMTKKIIDAELISDSIDNIVVDDFCLLNLLSH